MSKMIVTSLQADAGKTSLIVGLAKVLDQPFGYLKPFGDRLLYRKKRLWDYDASLISGIFALKDLPEDMSIGFDHSKLRYMYDESTSRQKLKDLVTRISRRRKITFIESGKVVSHGLSVYLDALTVCRHVNGRLMVVLSGNNDTVLDDTLYLKRHLDYTRIDFAGVIVNKVQDREEFNTTYRGYFTEMGVEVRGVIPFQPELTYPSVKFIAEVLFAKVITAEKALHEVVQNIFVGAMSGDAVLRVQKFRKEDKLIITSGDRSDMILAALETGSKAIILTNNILPPANLIARASEQNTPLLLVPTDTYQTAKRIDETVPLLVKEDTRKIQLLSDLVREYVDLSFLE